MSAALNCFLLQLSLLEPQSLVQFLDSFHGHRSRVLILAGLQLRLVLGQVRLEAEGLVFFFQSDKLFVKCVLLLCEVLYLLLELVLVNGLYSSLPLLLHLSERFFVTRDLLLKFSILNEQLVSRRHYI